LERKFSTLSPFPLSLYRLFCLKTFYAQYLAFMHVVLKLDNHVLALF
jgi:hypothetical protein